MKADKQFSIHSINPWRMLLFGVTGCLIPLFLFILWWNSTDVNFKGQYDHFFDWMILLTLGLSAVLTYLGFKLSAVNLRISLNSEGITVMKKTRFPFIPSETLMHHWDELKSYKYTEDNKGKVLKIELNDDKTITIAQANVLDSSKQFDEFYREFIAYFKGIE